MANSEDPDQTAPIGAVCSGSTLFASVLNLSVMLGKYLQQTTSADDIFRCIFFLALNGLKVHNQERLEKILIIHFKPQTGLFNFRVAKIRVILQNNQVGGVM